MHIVLGFLTTLVTVLYLLDRMGVNLGGLNPFYWRRRRAWAAKYKGDPIYSVEDPVHVAAVLLAGVAKLDGDISAEQKSTILNLFTTRFSMDQKAASELLASAAHLLGAPQVIDAQLNGVAERNKAQLSGDRAESLLDMMVEVATADGKASTKQQAFIDEIRSMVAPTAQNQGTWSSH